VTFEIIARSEWRPRPAAYTTKLRTPVSQFFIHHGADSGPKGAEEATEEAEHEYLRGTQAFHMDTRGFSDIAYSFGIMASGRIYEARGWDRVGGHTFNHNSISLAAEFAGNYHPNVPGVVTRMPTEIAIDAARFLISEGVRLGKLTPDAAILGHRDVGAQGGGTACPGDNLYARLADIREPFTGEEDDLGTLDEPWDNMLRKWNMYADALKDHYKTENMRTAARRYLAQQDRLEEKLDKALARAPGRAPARSSSSRTSSRRRNK